MFNFNAAIHMPTRKSAGRWQTQKSYKNVFFHEKNAVGHVTFAGQLTKSAGLIIHV